MGVVGCRLEHGASLLCVVRLHSVGMVMIYLLWLFVSFYHHRSGYYY